MVEIPTILKELATNSNKLIYYLFISNLQAFNLKVLCNCIIIVVKTKQNENNTG